MYCHSEPEPFTSFRINSAEAKPVLSQAEGNLVLCIAERLFAKNEILSFSFAQDRLCFAPQNDRPP